MIKQSTIDDYNRRKLVNLIREVSALHGGEPEFDKYSGEVLGESFLADYIAEVLKEWSNDLVNAIACFEDLKAQAVNLSRYSRNVPKREVREIPKVKGHGAFREHYEQLEKQQALGVGN